MDNKEQKSYSLEDLVSVASTELDNIKSNQVCNSVNSGTSGTNGFFVLCFDCGKTLGNHEIYSFDGKPYCRECRLKLEAQKKREAN